MKKYYVDEAKIYGSNNIPKFTDEDIATGNLILHSVFLSVTDKNGKSKKPTTTATICFALSDGNVYKVKTPIERLTAQCKKIPRVKKPSQNWGDFRFCCPFGKQQAENLVMQGKAKFIDTFENLQAEAEKSRNSGNKGKGIEYILAKIEHKKFDHTLDAANGSEYDNTEVKFYNLITGSGAVAHCPEI